MCLWLHGVVCTAAANDAFKAFKRFIRAKAKEIK